MAAFSTFLFDLDGTLIDHFAAIHRSHSHTLEQLGLPPPTMEQVRSAVGGGLDAAIAKLAGPARLDEALRIYRAYFSKTMLDDVVLLPGARELLETLHLRGAKLAVFTNKHGPSSRAICDHLGISALLDGVFGALDTPWLKPELEFARYAFEKLGVGPAGTLLVGDSPWDVQAAKNGGFKCWCVTTGTHNRNELAEAGADRIFPDLIALGSDLTSSA